MMLTVGSRFVDGCQWWCGTVFRLIIRLLEGLEVGSSKPGNGWMDGWTDGWMGGWISERLSCYHTFVLSEKN